MAGASVGPVPSIIKIINTRSARIECVANQRRSVPNLNNKCHVLFAGPSRRLLALPQRVVDGKCVDRHRQVLRVDLREALAARVVSGRGGAVSQVRRSSRAPAHYYSLEEPVEHVLVHLAGPRAEQLDHLLRLRIVAVERTELAAGVAEQDQEVLRLRARYLLQHLVLRVPIHHAREYTVFDRVQDDAPIRFGRRLLVQLGTWVGGADTRLLASTRQHNQSRHIMELAGGTQGVRYGLMARQTTTTTHNLWSHGYLVVSLFPIPTSAPSHPRSASAAHLNSPSWSSGPRKCRWSRHRTCDAS